MAVANEKVNNGVNWQTALYPSDVIGSRYFIICPQPWGAKISMCHEPPLLPASFASSMSSALIDWCLDIDAELLPVLSIASCQRLSIGSCSGVCGMSLGHFCSILPYCFFVSCGIKNDTIRCLRHQIGIIPYCLCGTVSRTDYRKGLRPICYKMNFSIIP